MLNYSVAELRDNESTPSYSNHARCIISLLSSEHPCSIEEETGCHDIAQESYEGNNVRSNTYCYHRLDKWIDDGIDNFL